MLDGKGNLPAHIGAMCSADEAVLRVLLKAYPAALDKSNSEGKLLAVLAQACPAHAHLPARSSHVLHSGEGAHARVVLRCLLPIYPLYEIMLAVHLSPIKKFLEGRTRI